MARKIKNAKLEISTIAIKDSVLAKLNSLLEGWDKPPMTGLGLFVQPGHEYWVVLEYGAGPTEKGPRKEARNEQFAITIPANIPGPKEVFETHEYVSGGQIMIGNWYPIKARKARWLKFVDRHGVFRKERIVYHPGMKARGFLRRAIRQWKREFMMELEQFALTAKLGGVIPTRRDVVALVNTHLRILLEDVRSATPELGEDPRHPGHLRDAWGVNLAK